MTKKRFVTTLILACCTITCALSACTTNGAHVHTFGEWVEVTAPTCTEGGTEERTCGCGESETRPKPAFGHALGEFIKTEEEHYKKCSRCGEETVKEAHSYNAENSCVTCGYKLEYTDTLAYSEIKDGEEVIAYSVDGFAEDATPTEKVTVPAYHNGKPVTAIGKTAFYATADNPDTVIKSVTLPSTVTELGDFAFNHCTALEEINLNNVSTFGSCVFWDTALKSVEISNATAQISDFAFYEIPTLEKITINSSVTVDDYAFGENPALKELVFGKNAEVTFGEGHYFYLDTALETITIHSNNVVFGISTLSSIEYGTVDVIYSENVTAIPEKAMGNQQTNGNVLKTLTIGKNVKTIGDRAFFQCQFITEVVLPEGLTEIGENAFGGCSSLVKATIPKSVTTIGDYSFGSLKEVHYGGTAADWAKINFVDSSVSSPLYGGAVLYVNGEPCDTLDLRGADKVNAAAFFGAKYTKIILGEELTELGHQCFAHSSPLISIFPFGSAEYSNKLEQLVILCKNLDLGITETSYFSNTFNADTEIYYYGTAEEMDANVTVGERHRLIYDKKELTHYFYSESQPVQEGNFWHFDGSGNVIKW